MKFVINFYTIDTSEELFDVYSASELEQNIRKSINAQKADLDSPHMGRLQEPIPLWKPLL